MTARVRCTYDDATHGACMAWATRRLTVRCHGRARGVVSEMCTAHADHVVRHGVEAIVEVLPGGDEDAEVGARIDAAAPWVRRLTAVVVAGTSDARGTP